VQQDDVSGVHRNIQPIQPMNCQRTGVSRRVVQQRQTAM
jgi:hypothetical protein